MLSAMLTILLLAFLSDPSLAAIQFSDVATYDGAWALASPHTLAGPGKSDSIVNHCNRTASYYTCEQIVNGKPTALLVFVPADAPLTYHTQTVLPDGYSTGRGDLTIAGDHWTFSGKDSEDGKTTWFRTENYFTGRDKIHFEQYESSDGKTWEMKNSGGEVRQPATLGH